MSQARRRLAAVGRVLALLGFVTVLGSLATIGVAAWTTTDAVLAAIDAGELHGDYVAYAPDWWKLPLASLVGAFLIGRLGRLLAL